MKSKILFNKKGIITGLLTITLFAIVPAIVFAGGDTSVDDSAMDGIRGFVLSYMQGNLGLIISLLALVVGAGAAIMKAHAMYAVNGLVIAMILFYGPEILSGIFSYGIPL